MWGGVGAVSLAFVCAGWVVCRVFLRFPALSCPLFGFPRPSCLLTLFRRRPWAVLFSIPGWWWRVAPSVLLFLHTFLLLSGVSDCMYLAALHTLFCLRRLARASIVWAYLSLPIRACRAGRVLSATPLWWLPSLARLSLLLFPLVWRGVASNILVLVSSHGCPWLWCVWLPPCLYLALLASACMHICGRHIFCSLPKRACGVGMFSRLHLLVTFVGVVTVVLFSFALCVVARHVTYLYSVAGGVVVACSFLVLCFCVCCTFLWLCVAPSVRSLVPSFTLHAPSYHVAFPR